MYFPFVDIRKKFHEHSREWYSEKYSPDTHQ
jgi:hypothetical protein